MSRECCSVCLRAQVSCICHLFADINNDVHVVVLQHPSEVKQTKGTVTLLSHSLSSCEILVGEDFNNNEALAQILSKYKNNVALLYPSEQASVLKLPQADRVLSSNTNIGSEWENHLDETNTPPNCIILIDGTWKKSYKMYMINQMLHHIPHLTLPDDIQGDYRIRKTKKEQAFSSLEACVYALISLESNESKYKPLLKSFGQFNDFQLSFKSHK
jgi:DTW domain-containing protein YfiP